MFTRLASAVLGAGGSAGWTASFCPAKATERKERNLAIDLPDPSLQRALSGAAALPVAWVVRCLVVLVAMCSGQEPVRFPPRRSRRWWRRPRARGQGAGRARRLPARFWVGVVVLAIFVALAFFAGALVALFGAFFLLAAIGDLLGWWLALAFWALVVTVVTAWQYLRWGDRALGRGAVYRSARGLASPPVVGAGAVFTANPVRLLVAVTDGRVARRVPPGGGVPPWAGQGPRRQRSSPPP
jgi:hypothetical protein